MNQATLKFSAVFFQTLSVELPKLSYIANVLI